MTNNGCVLLTSLMTLPCTSGFAKSQANPVCGSALVRSRLHPGCNIVPSLSYSAAAWATLGWEYLSATSALHDQLDADLVGLVQASIDDLVRHIVDDAAADDLASRQTPNHSPVVADRFTSSCRGYNSLTLRKSSCKCVRPYILPLRLLDQLV